MNSYLDCKRFFWTAQKWLDGGVIRRFRSGIFVSSLMRRAVSVAEDDAGLADDPEDGRRRFKFSVFREEVRGAGAGASTAEARRAKGRTGVS
jgi:hypothetical protein